MVFPFEKEIDWEKFIVKSKSESKLIRKLLDFWETKSDKEIQEIQTKCKKIHEEYFELKSFGNKIHQLLINFEPRGGVRGRGFRRAIWSMPR